MRGRIRLFLAALLVPAVLIGGCEGRRDTASSLPAEGSALEKGAESEELSVSLLPPSPTVEDDLQAVTRGGSGTFSFRWERNGEEIPGRSEDRLPAHSAKKGDTVAVVVETESGKARASTPILNTPPSVVSVPFADPHVRQGVDIIAKPQGVDVDGDSVSYRYVWSINGSEIVGNDSPVLAGDRFQKGDLIALTVFPSDGEEEGRPINGAEFRVPNAPPFFISSPPLEFRARMYTYAARAEDPDGDTLTYSLESAPVGMTIDNATGDIHWQINARDSGEHRIRIVAQDDEGMRAFQEFNLNLSISE